MKCTVKTEVNEYNGLYIQSQWREAKGNIIGTVMSVAFYDEECTELAHDKNGRPLSHASTTKDVAMLLLGRKINKAMKDMALVS